MTFRDLVTAALDAGDVAPDSAAGRYALRAAALYARWAHCYCASTLALDLVLLAMSETARGVRVV